MTARKALHSQLGSIMEALTKAAVAEICELVDEGYAVLQLEISRSHEENEALRRKMELIESIVGRGHRGLNLVLDYQGLEEKEEDVPIECPEPAALLCSKQPTASTLRSASLVPNTEVTTEAIKGDSSSMEPAVNLQQHSDQVVIIKEERIKEDLDENHITEELLLIEDGEEMTCNNAHKHNNVRPSEPDDSNEVPSGISVTSAPVDVQMWNQHRTERAEQQDQQLSNQSSSSDMVFDLSGETDSYSPTSTHTTKQFLRTSGECAMSLSATLELKQDISMVSSRLHDADMDLSSSWTNQALQSVMAHRPYLKPNHRLPVLDKTSDFNSPSIPLAFALSSSRLNPAELNKYSRDRRFTCSYCGKCCTSAASLETHIRIHTGERPYSCAQCGKRFTQSGHLKTHQNVHTGGRPFACEFCGKRFTGKQNLRIHQHKHHHLTEAT
ncbi:zinc finger protein 35-like [Gouania willdenowi]|uniref:zinc finger protein 35-like n=1 Tax=Gouania willdenowi TaxID=441366 RepID=UPI00105640C9|nr:zinc finger protein 35-like [Gouania willdenowi]